MPVYEYGCANCGAFSASRPMSASGSPQSCPTCGKRAPRILSATAVGVRGRGRRARGYPEPKLVKRDREPAAPAPHAAHGDRPWMLGH